MNKNARQVVHLTTAVAAAAVVALAPIASAGAHASLRSPLQATAATAPCTAFELPAPKGWDGQATTMNDAGILVGTVVDLDGVEHPAYWTPRGLTAAAGYRLHMPDVPSAGEFLDVNDAGTAVAFDDNAGQGFVYDIDTGHFAFLPDFAGTSYDRPRRINAEGVIAGTAADADGNPFAATWSAPYASAHRLHFPGEEQVVDWVDPGDGTVYEFVSGSEADGINDRGQVVGWDAVVDPRLASGHGRGRYFRHLSNDPGSSEPVDASREMTVPIVMTAPGRFVELDSHGGQAYTFALNDTGTVVGDHVDDPDAWILHPVYWRGGAEHDFGMPGDATDGQALNVDDAWATGYVDFADGTTQGWAWTGTGLLELLPNLPGYERGSYSHGVNARLHQFSGTALLADSDHHVGVVWQCKAGFSTRG